MSADEPAAPPAPQGDGKLRKKTAQSALWLILRFGLRQGSVTIAFFVIAALSSPETFGLASIALAFGMFSRLAVVRGIRDLIILRSDLDRTATSTAAWLNLGLGTLLGAPIALSAPYIAEFYGSQQLVWPIVVSAFIPILSAFSAVQEALLEREFRHRVLTMAQGIASVIAAPLAVLLVVMHLEIWAPIALTVLEMLIFATIVFGVGRYIPGLRFSLSEARRQISFVWPLIVSSVFDGGYMRIAQLIVGAFLGAQEVAFFRLGLQANQTLTQLLNAPINQALLAGFSRIKDGHGSQYLRALSVFAAITFPVYLGVAALSPVAFPLALGQDWAMAGTISAVLCFTIFANVYPHILRTVLAAKDATRAQLAISIASTLFGLVAVAIGSQFGMMEAAYGFLLKMLVGIPMALFIARRIVGTSIASQIAATFGYAVAAILMFLGVVWLVGALVGVVSAWLALVVGAAAGAAFYLVATWSVIRYALPKAYEPLVAFTPNRFQWVHLPAPANRRSEETDVQ